MDNLYVEAEKWASSLGNSCSRHCAGRMKRCGRVKRDFICSVAFLLYDTLAVNLWKFENGCQKWSLGTTPASEQLWVCEHWEHCSEIVLTLPMSSLWDCGNQWWILRAVLRWLIFKMYMCRGTWRVKVRACLPRTVLCAGARCLLGSALLPWYVITVQAAGMARTLQRTWLFV